MAQTKPSVTKKFNEVIFPKMETNGFIKLTSKKYARLLENEILQMIFIKVKGTLRREYVVSYGTYMISEPHEFFGGILGGEFTKGSSGRTYGALDEKMLDKSIQRVLVAYQEEVLPILTKTSSIELFIDAYEQSLIVPTHLNKTGHQDFTLACAYSINGDNLNAKHYCTIARQKYENQFINDSRLEWAKAGAERAEELHRELEKGDPSLLHLKWRKQTIEELEIQNVFK